MSVIKELRRTASGLWSLVVGLGVTGKNFLKPQVTVHYPRQIVPNLDSYRGHIDLVPLDDDPQTPRCICCMTCINVCPSQCLSLTVDRDRPAKGRAEPAGEAGDLPTPKDGGNMLVVEPKRMEPPKKAGPKRPATFIKDYNLCSLCGLCVQNCPVDSLMFSRDIKLAGYRREDFVLDLLGRMRARELPLVPALGSGVASIRGAQGASAPAEGQGVAAPAPRKAKAADRGGPDASGPDASGGAGAGQPDASKDQGS